MRRKKESEKTSSVKSGRWFIKITSLILSLLVVFFMIPVVSYAEMIETAEELLSAKPEEAEEKISLSYTSEDPAYELVEMREERAKYFRMEDGTYVVASYEYPVHTMQDGEWVDVDNSLTDNGNEIFTSNARIKFAKKITGNGSLFTLHESNHKLTLSLIGAVKKTEGKIIASESEGEKEEKKTLGKLINLENITSRVIYEDILEGVDIEYVLESTNLKENIIVKEKSEDGYSYSFELSLNNLTARMTPEGDVQIVNERGVVVYTIPAPVVYDSNGEYADPSSAQQSLEYMGNGKCRLTVSVSEDWMNAEERVYPVTVDPTLSVADSSVIDLYIDSERPYENFDDQAYLSVKDTHDAYWMIKNAYLPDIPSSAYITSAVLRLGAYGHGYVGAYEIESVWDETLTYSKTQDIEIDCGTQFGVGIIASAPSDYAKVDNGETAPELQEIELNITEIVKSWFTGDNTGVGFKVIQSDTGYGYVYLKSYEDSNVSADNAYKPKFIMRYVDTKGIEDYYSYSSQSAGLAGSGSINLATGNLTFAINTLTSSDYLMPVSPTLVYDGSVAGSSYVYGGKSKIAFSSQSGLAYGFKLNLCETVVKESYVDIAGVEKDVYIYSDGDGTEHYFYQALDENDAPIANTYHDDSGLRLTLVDSSDGFTITSLDGTVKSFTKGATCPYETAGAWYLSRITDRAGNAVEITLNSNYLPTSTKLIPNGSTAIETLRFIYNSSGKLAVIRNVASGESVVFKYSNSTEASPFTDGTKYLRNVIYAHGTASLTDSQWLSYANGNTVSGITTDASAYYEYNSFGRIRKAEDNLSQSYLLYIYPYSSGAITSVTEYGSSGGEGQSIKIIYRNGYTEVTTSGTDDKISTTADNIITRYTFDRSARVISSYSTCYDRAEIYGASAGIYEEQDNVKNNIKESVAIGGSPVNYLLNGSFEAYNLAYWTKTSNVYNNSFSSTGNSSALIEAVAGANKSISQKVFLPVGTYTISLDYVPTTYDGVTVLLQAKSVTNNTYYCSEELATSDIKITGYTTASVTFDVPYVISGGDKVEICITVSTTSDYTGYSYVLFDDISLVEGTKASDVNLVNVGDFDGYGIDSAGNNIPASTFWRGNYSLVSSSEFGKVAKVTSTGVSSSKTITQTIMEDSSGNFTEYYNNSRITFFVSAYGYANSSMCNNSNAFFGIRVKVYYNQASVDDEVFVEHLIPFSGKNNHWQYACGIVNCEVDQEIKNANNDKSYNVISKIEVICEYSGQLSGSYACFDNVSFVKTTHTSGNRYVYDKSGNLIKYNNYENSVYYEYDENNDLTMVANNLGLITNYVYDNNRNLIKEITYNFTSLDGLSTVYPTVSNDEVYDSEGNLIEPDPNFDPENHMIKTPKQYTNYEYNSYGLLTKTTTYAADPMSVYPYLRQKAGTAPVINSTEYITDVNSQIFGAVYSETDSNSVRTKYFYDLSNGLLKAVINENSDTGTSYTYDAVGRLIKAVPAFHLDGGDDYAEYYEFGEVDYSYNIKGYVDKISTDSTTYNFNYDGFGNVSSVYLGENETLVSYSYNSNNGKLNKITYGNGYAERYVYDALDNLSEIWYTVGGVESKAYEYKYAQNGQLFSVTDLTNGLVSVYEYDRKDRLIGVNTYSTEDYNYDLNTTISYDVNDRINEYDNTVSLPSSSGAAIKEIISTDIDYGANGQLVQSSITGANTITYEYKYNEYDLKSTQIGTTYSGFYSKTEYEYEVKNGKQSASRIDRYISTVGTESENVTTRYDFTHDDSNNITSITYSDGKKISYEYDSINQLVRENNQPIGKTYTYTYDTAGNILEKKVYDYSTVATHQLGTPIDTIVYVYGNGDWGDQLTRYDGHIITYDRVGNPLSYNNGSAYTFTWEGRRLKTAVKGTQSFTFSYNDEGIRTSKTVNGVEHNYILNGNQIAAEYWGSNLIVYIYDVAGTPIGMQYLDSSTSSSAWQMFWYEKNLQGDIVAVYNDAGTKLVSYKYDAWGNFTTQYHNNGLTSTARYNPFTYRGYYYDTDLGLYYLNSRYYDSTVGRFINADGVVSDVGGDIRGYNMYSYCFNNPVNMVDSKGEYPWWIVAVLTYVIVIPTAVNHFVNAINKKIIDKELEDHYSEKDANEEIDDYLLFKREIEGVTIKIDDDGNIKIENSYKIKDRYDRQFICEILARSDLTNRSSGNLSAEWLGHNVIYFFTKGDNVKDVDLDREKDDDSWINYATKILEILGWE